MRTACRASVLFGIAAILVLLLSGTSNAAQIMGNFTIASHYILTSNLNYSGWIILESGESLNLSGYSTQAKGMILYNGSSLYVPEGAGILRLSYLYNNGTIYYSKNILNASLLSNYGSIIHQNWLLYYGNLPMSYGGSGGGGGTNYGTGATEGSSTQVSGGAIGNDPAGPGSEALPLGNLSSPVFNESILSGASGGNSSCTPGSQGAYGFIINASAFENFGLVSNQGETASHTCYNGQYYGGGGGAGGGGVLEVIFSSTYLNEGSYNLEGGGLNPYFNGPWTYGGWGGKGGAGQLVVVRVAHDSTSGQNATMANATLNTPVNTSVSIPISALSYINKTLIDLTSEISGYQSEIYMLNKSYYNVEAALAGFNDTLFELASKDSGYQAEISGIVGRYGEIQSSLSGIYNKESLIQNQTAQGYDPLPSRIVGYNYTTDFSELNASDKAVLSGLASIEDQEYWIQSRLSSDYRQYTSNLSNDTIFLARMLRHENYSEVPYPHENFTPAIIISSQNYSVFGRQQPAANPPNILSEIYSGFVQVVTFIPDMVDRVV